MIHIHLSTAVRGVARKLRKCRSEFAGFILRNAMNDFMALITPPAPPDVDEVRRLARHGCLDIHRVSWLRCYLSRDGTRMLCWYHAPDAESVRLVLRHQGFTDAVVRAAVVSGDADPGALAESRDCRVLELPADSGTSAALSARLDDAHGGRYRALISQQGDLALLVVDHDRADAVADTLGSAGIALIDEQNAVEIDPRPASLFSTLPGAASRAGRPSRRAGQAVAPGDAGGMLDAVVIGAGLSGISALHRLLGMGLVVRLYESGSGAGGVWHWNRYPGARVDSEVYTYVFSFSDDLVREWDWQELFAPQAEIARYFEHVIDRFDLRRHMRFDSPVVAVHFDDGGGFWTIETADGERMSARYLVAATGALTAPQMPDYPGLDTFSGVSCHTARWPCSGVALAGRRVGVIGTGATGVQVIQTIAGEAGELYVFQRTPTYCVPQRNRPMDDADRERIRRDWGRILDACRDSWGGFVHDFHPVSGLAVSAADRRAKFEELWRSPGFAFWLGNYADLMMNPEVNEYASDFLREKIREQVDDPDVARRLIPDHPLGTKRVPLENGYYEAFNRPDVHLVDLRETPIERIVPEGVRTSRETIPLDVLIHATGFDAGTGALARIDVRGTGGASLADKWRHGAQTFLGLMVSGFPNLFLVNGPHNAAALSNAGRSIEQNVTWIARCIEHVRESGFTRIDASAEAEKEWTEHVVDAANGTVLAQMTDSWFYGANTSGKPRRVTIYAGGAREHRRHCDAVANAGYPGLDFS